VVLLTGQAADAQAAARFAELIAKLPAVKRVHNEVVVGPRRRSATTAATPM